MFYEYKILQIIPAVDWKAEYGECDGEEGGFDNLVCWALVEDKDGKRSVVGMVADDWVDFAESACNFKGYVRRTNE